MKEVKTIIERIREFPGTETKCGNSERWSSEWDFPLTSPTGITPYPTMLAAFSLAAIDSPETAIVYIAHWLKSHEATKTVSTPQQWYYIRAEIELRSLITQYIRGRVETHRLVSFQRQLTDQFRALMKIELSEEWKKLCSAFSEGGVHAELGKRLAFQYAIARNYLFEQRTPSSIQAAYTYQPIETVTQLEADIDEAKILFDAENCYKASHYMRERLIRKAQMHVSGRPNFN